MIPFLNALPKRPVLWDGGMGSELIAAGLPSGIAPELWNIERPDIIQNIHMNYFTSGSDVVQSNTFGGNRIRLKDSKCPYTVDQVNRAGLTIALNAKNIGKYVAANIGPTGLSMPPLGKVSEAELEDIFSEQLNVIKDFPVDLIAIETMTDLREARAALKAAIKIATLPVSVSMTFRKTKRGFFTIMGDSAEISLKTLVDDGASIVGANCTLSSKDMIELAQILTSTVKQTLILQPNAGEPILNTKNGKTEITYPESPLDFEHFVKSIIALGIDIIGGCCGTTPQHIKAMAHVRDHGDHDDIK